MVVSIIFQLLGSLALLLYGMQLMSDGIQKSAGQSLHRVLGLMTSNRIFAVITGMFVTMIIQSSGATTVMVVSFVNAGLMTLAQSVGVIFGANIGTTITAWIVTLFGFSFSISKLAIPIFGIGYLCVFIKKINKTNLTNFGEVLMGFALLFFGLDLLKNAIPGINAENAGFLVTLNNGSFLSILAGIGISALVTMLLHSSSAVTAIVITMATQGLLSWDFSAALVLGSNIGSTIDAVMAAMGTKVNARRTALVHVLFNVSGTIIALIFLRPLLNFVDFITPGEANNNIAVHIAMLHTIFNTSCTILFLPFVNQIAKLTERVIKPHKDETPSFYKFEFSQVGIRENSEAAVICAEKEISDMTDIVIEMFERIQKGLSQRNETFISENMEQLSATEDYADQMQEEISKFLVNCQTLPLNDKLRNNISMMLRIVDDLESLTDDCYSVAVLIKRSVEKKMEFAQEDLERLDPYMDLVQHFLEFIKENINKPLNHEKLRLAEVMEDQIDMFRKNLKKIARKRLEQGANVKAELLYLDVVRHIEKMGDHAFSISESLSQTQ